MRSFFVLGLVGLAGALTLGCSDGASPTPGDGSGPFGPLGDRKDLPVAERFAIENLEGPVDVVRDDFGRIHIYATTTTDAMRVEGYMIAKDRTLQVDLLRRVSEGRLAELVGQSDPSTIDTDIAFRHIGLHRVAKAQYEALDPQSELKAVLDAYADGVTQLFRKIRSKEVRLPDGVFSIDTELFTDWTGADSLAIGRLEEYLLSYDGDEEIENQILLDAARGAFPAGDPDPLVLARHGLERDLFRFAPAAPATTTMGFPSPRALVAGPEGAKRKVQATLAVRPADMAAMSAGYRAAMKKARAMIAPEGFGSNNWAVAPSQSATGHALLASDPHLSLPSPAIFWPVSIDVAAERHDQLSGIAFPGLPGIILGHNGWVAWGATVADYDVTDIYAETLTPDGNAVIFGGETVPLETIDEVIAIQGKEPYTYQLKVVPHHGPIQPTITPDHKVAPLDPATGALSVKWTGAAVTNELDAVLGLMRAHDVDEARAALAGFDVGAQNWMLADTTGNILWTTHSLVPLRDERAFDWDPATYTGTLPCYVLPGDGTAEWTGFVPGDTVPWEKNPAKGYIATANNDPVGGTLDDDPSNDTLPDGTPLVLSCTYDIGFRESRIQERLGGAAEPITTDEMASIQGDARSPLGARLANRLVLAIDRAEAERQSPGSHPDLAGVVADPAYVPETIAAVRAALDAWEGLGYEAAAGVDLDTNQPLADGDPQSVAAQATLVFNAWLVRVVRRTLGDELERMGQVALPRQTEAKAFLRLVEADPPTLATFDPATADSALWDDLATPEVETRDERFVRGLVDALTDLAELAGADPAAWRWGRHHTITFGALISAFGELSIPPGDDPLFGDGFPRHGDNFGVDASNFASNVGLSAKPNFTYGSGPTQRFVVDMAPDGPKAYNALPGGNVWDHTSPHFRDEAEYWRKNTTHAIPYTLDEVVAAAESRAVATPPGQ